MTSTIYQLSKKLKNLNYRSIYQLGSLLKSYSKTNERDWCTHINSKNFNKYTNYNKQLYYINNIECNLMSIPKGLCYYSVSNNNTSFLVLNGCINKVYIEDNMEADRYYGQNMIGYIYKNEIHGLINNKESSILLTLTKHDDILNKPFSSFEKKYIKLKNNNNINEKYERLKFNNYTEYNESFYNFSSIKNYSLNNDYYYNKLNNYKINNKFNYKNIDIDDNGYYF